MELFELVQQLLIMAALLTAITGAFTEVVKKALKIKKRYIPIVSVGVGMMIGLGLFPLTVLGWYYMLVVGFIAGLTASGSFDIAKAIKELVAKETKKDE